MKPWSEQEEADRLKERFKSLKKVMSRAEFAKRFGVPGGDAMIYQHINAIRPISMEAALAYAKGFCCSLGEVSPRLAQEAMRSASRLDEKEYEALRIESAKKEDLSYFNVLDVKAACGDGATNEDYPEIISSLVMPIGESQRLIGSTNKSGNIKIIVATKDSMIPSIYPDDLLFVDTSIKEYVGEAVYILLHGGELVCKRISLVGDEITVSSDNNAYPNWSWVKKHKETRVIGKVIRVLPMKFKKFGSV